MDNIYLPVIEALIFSAEEPLTTSEISKAIKEIDGEEVKEDEIESAVDMLNEKYKNHEISINIIRVSNGFLFATKPEYAKYVGYLSSEKSSRRLSQAALETLAIIAYKQPITKPEIEAIRGVNSDYMINTLLEKNLITIKGRAETIGRPLLYVTTDTFLIYFGLNKLSDLPKPREIEEIMQDADFQEQKRKLLMNQIEEIVENETNQESESD